MSSLKVTNILLSLIAALLFVLVVQNFSSRRSPHSAFNFPSDLPPAMSDQEPGSAPHPSQPSMPEGGPQDASEFHPASMVIGSLACPNDASLTLGDPGCAGKDADARRKTVEDALAQNLPISKVYDLVVEKYGEKALIDSALQIRKGRRTTAN